MFHVQRVKAEERFTTGAYLGLVDRSDEILVGTEEGVFKANTMRRVAMEQRGDEKVIQQMQGLPWKLRPGSTLPGEEPEVYKRVRLDSKPTQVTELPPILPAASNLGGQTGPRRVYLRREVEMRPVAEGGYGLTENCR
eukprot:2373644-Amphidinium_carterae.1